MLVPQALQSITYIFLHMIFARFFLYIWIYTLFDLSNCCCIIISSGIHTSSTILAFSHNFYHHVLLHGLGSSTRSALYLNKLDSPSPNDALCQVLLKLAQWFWRRLNLVNVLFAFSLLSTLGKGCGLLCEQTWKYFTKGYFVPSLVEMANWFWKRILKVVNLSTTCISQLSPLGKKRIPSFEEI